MSSNFINKIFNAEVSPPPTVWNSIAAELDKIDHPHFVDKINAASIEPPASAWENVASSLDKATSGKLVPLNTRWIKWAAAAVFVGILVYSATVFMRPNSEENSVTASLPKKDSDAASVNSMKGIPSRANDIHPSIAFVENRRPVRTAENIASGEGQEKSLIRPALIETAEGEKTTAKHTDGEPKISDNVPSTSSHFIPPPEYFVVTAPNGERVRISSKFSDAVTSLYGGDNVDYLWKSRFDSWKSKLMTNPSFIPAAGNFLDIMELKDLLKEQ